MTDKTKIDNEEVVVDQSPAEAKNTEHMIPKSRLDEEITKRKDLEVRLETLEKEKNQQLEDRLAEQGKYKELAEERASQVAELLPKAEQLEAYEHTLEGVLAAQLEDMPEEYKNLVPDELSTQQKLKWLAKNKATLMKPKPADIGAGKRGGSNTTTVELSAAEIQAAKNAGISLEDYAKNKK